MTETQATLTPRERLLARGLDNTEMRLVEALAEVAVQAEAMLDHDDFSHEAKVILRQCTEKVRTALDRMESEEPAP